MKTRRTKEQIRKDNYNKDVDAYNFYVVNLDTKRAETGFEFREDAVDLLNDYDDKKKYKVVSKKALKTMGIENPNESFKYEAGGDFQSGVYAGGGEVRRFNRHEQMDSETREEVLDVLSDPDLSGYLTNCLYGLFDGYDYSQTEYFKKDMNKLKSKDSKLYNRVVDIYKKIDTYKFEKYDEYADGGYFDGSIPKVNTYMTNYAVGGSLQAHGIKEGDTFLTTISGVIQKVKDKNGNIVFINLANGERDSQPPLPFNKGGAVRNERLHVNKGEDYEVRYSKPRPNRKGYKGLRSFDEGGDLFEDYKRQPKKLSEIVNFYMDKFNEGDYDYQDSKNFLKEVEAIGYTFDYGLDNEPYGLRPIGTKFKQYATGGGVGIEEEIDLIQDYRLRVRKPVMPERKLTEQEWAEKHNAGAYEFMGNTKMATGGKFQDFKVGDSVTIIKPFPNGDMTGKKATVEELSAKNYGVIYISIDGKRIAVLSDYISKDNKMMATGGALVGNQKRIDLNKNGKIDAEDFKLLRSSMNGAWRNERKHVNHDEDYEVRYAKKKPNRTGYKGKRKFKEGGGISNFERLSRVVARNYEGKRVKPQYQKEYGKVYSKSEAKEVGDKVAGKVKANQKMNTGGETKKGGKGGIMVLAKQIRKDGESWQDALKRAGQQLK